MEIFFKCELLWIYSMSENCMRYSMVFSLEFD